VRTPRVQQRVCVCVCAHTHAGPAHHGRTPHPAARTCDAKTHSRITHALRPFPEPHSVLVLDNASTHHNHEFVKLVEDTGALIVYMPPYSPEFSPVRNEGQVRRAVCVCVGGG
jgi:hypothetical protein